MDYIKDLFIKFKVFSEKPAQMQHLRIEKEQFLKQLNIQEYD